MSYILKVSLLITLLLQINLYAQESETPRNKGRITVNDPDFSDAVMLGLKNVDALKFFTEEKYYSSYFKLEANYSSFICTSSILVSAPRISFEGSFSKISFGFENCKNKVRKFVESTLEGESF